MRSKFYALLSGLLLLTVVVSACAPSPAAPSGQQPTPAAEIDLDQPAATQRLRILASADSRSTGAFPSVCGIFAGWTGVRGVFYPLVNIADDDLTLTPGLATDWEANPDFTQWTFHIDPEAMWSDGTPVTAEQIKRSLEFRYLPEQQCPWGSSRWLGTDVVGAQEAWDNGEPDIPGITAPDEHTLVFDLVGSLPYFAHQFASGFIVIFKPEPAYADPDPAHNHLTWIGAGPFMYEDLDIDTGSALLVHNPHWWRDPPVLEEIEIVPVINDPQSRLIGYLNNEYDAFLFDTALWEQIKGTPVQEDIHRMPVTTFNAFGFREDIPPFDDINVRKAFIHAIDFDAVAESLLTDTPNSPHYSSLPPGNACSDTSAGKSIWSFDPELAKQELSQSKYGGPEGLPPIYLAMAGNFPLITNFAQVFQQMWQQNLGVQINLVQYNVADPESFKQWQIFRTGEGIEGLDVADQLGKAYLSTSPHFCNTESWDRGGQICEAVCPECTEQRAAWQTTDDLITAMQGTSPNDPAYCEQYSAIEEAFNAGYHFMPLYSGGSFWLIKPWVVNAHIGQGYHALNHIEDTLYIAEH